MAVVTFFVLLIFSCIITSLSKFYLNKDMQLVHSLPVSPSRIFVARWSESTLDSSWMVAIYSMPFFLSYGVVYRANTVYFLPLFVLAQLLIVLTNVLLHVSPFMMALSVVTVAFLVPGIVAMGIGLGTAYPDPISSRKIRLSP